MPEARDPENIEPDLPERLPPRDQESEERRRHGFFRRFVVRWLMWSLAVLASLLFLGERLLDAPRTREWARREIETRASAALQREVKLDAVSFELIPLTVSVEGLSIGGGPDFPGDPFLVLRRAEVEADLEIFSRRRLRLRTVKLDRPQLDLRFTANGDNLIGGGGQKGEKTELNIAIDRVEIDHGQVLLDHEPIELSFVAENFSSRLVGLGHNQLRGEVQVPRLMLALPNAEPLDLAVAGKVEVSTEKVDIEEAILTGPGLELITRGTCDWSGKGGQGDKCDLETRGHADGGVFARLGYFDQLAGDLRFEGRFAWRGAVGWRGRVSADRLGLLRFDLANLESQLAVDRFGAHLSLLGADYAGGDLRGNLAIDLSTPGDPLTVALEADGVSLDPLFADIGIPVHGLASKARGQVSFKAPLREALTAGNGEGELEILPAEPPGIPFEGIVPLRVENGVLRLGSVNLHAPRQGLLAGGFYDLGKNRGRFDFDVATSDAAEIVDLLMEGRGGEGSSEADALWRPVEGIGRAKVDLQLEPGSFKAGLELDLQQVSTAQLKGVEARGSLDLTSKAVENLRLDLGHTGSALTVAGRVPFDSQKEPIDLKIDAFSWPLAEAKPLLPFDLPLDGPVSGHLDLQLADGKTRGGLDAHIAPGVFTLRAVPFDNLEAHLAWDENRMRFQEVEISTPAGVVRGGGSFDLASGELDIRARGTGLDIAQSPLAAFRPSPDLKGLVTVEATLRGTLDRPRIDSTTELVGLELGGRRLPGRSQLRGAWDGHEVRVSGRLVDAISLEGGGLLDTQAGTTDLAVDVAAADLGQLAGLLGLDPNYQVGGELAGRFALRGALATPELAVELGRTRISVAGHTLESRPGSRLALQDGSWRIAGLAFDEAGGDGFLRLDGGTDSAGALAVTVAARLGAEWIEPLLAALAPGMKLRPRGPLALEGTLGGGGAGAFSFTGRADLQGIDMAVPGIDEGLRGLRGTVLFTPDHIDLGRLEGKLAGGNITVSGQADLPRAAANGVTERPFTYALQLSGRDLGLRSVQGWAVGGDLDLTLRSVERGHFLGGRADIRRFDFRREIKLDVATLLRDFLRKQRLEVQPASSSLAAFQLNVEVRADHTVRISNNLADLRGSANFNLRGTLAAPLVYGEMSVDPGGKLRYNDSDYLIERGRLIFADPLKIDPEIDLVAQTRVREFDISLAIFGTLNRLETRFTSQPPLPDVDVFRLLAQGDFGGDPSQPNLQQRTGEETSLSAASFLYGQAASAIGERVSNLFGLDKFRVDPLVGTSGDNLSAARVTVGKRLSRRLSLTYSVDPSTTESQRLQVEWRLTEGLVLVLTQNGDSTYSADARWDTSF